MEPRVFFFGYTDFAGRMQAESLLGALAAGGFHGELVEPERYGRTIGEIVLGAGGGAPGKGASGPMACRFLLFSGFSGEALDRALDLCRGEIRAVLTASNSRMTGTELAAELLAEKRSL